MRITSFFRPPIDTASSTTSIARLLRPLFPDRTNLPDGTVITPPTGGNGVSTLPSLDFSPTRVPILTQTKNACGTTSLAMILNYLTGRTDFNPADIDRVIRRSATTGTAPSHLVDYARDLGMSAGMYNNSSFDELMDHVAKGRPVMVALDKFDNDVMNVKDHYVIVTGFETDANGEIGVKIRDPKGSQYTMTHDQFMKEWGKTSDGFNNFMTVFAPPGTRLPADRLDGAEHSIAIAAAGRNLLNNFDRLISPDSAGSFVHGLLGTPTSFATGLVTGIGWGLSHAGKWLVNEAKDWPPGLKHLGMFVGHLIDLPGGILTSVGAGLSDLFDKVSSGMGKLIDGDFGGAWNDVKNGAKKAVGGVVNAVGGAVKSVGKAVAGFFGF